MYRSENAKKSEIEIGERRRGAGSIEGIGRKGEGRTGCGNDTKERMREREIDNGK